MVARDSPLSVTRHTPPSFTEWQLDVADMFRTLVREIMSVVKDQGSRLWWDGDHVQTWPLGKGLRIG